MAQHQQQQQQQVVEDRSTRTFVPSIVESLTASAHAAGMTVPPDVVTPTLIRAIRQFELEKWESREQRWRNFQKATQSLWESTSLGLAHIQETQQQCCHQFQDELVQIILQLRHVEQQHQQQTRQRHQTRLGHVATTDVVTSDSIRLRHFRSLVAMVQMCQKMHDESEQHQASLIARCKENEAALRSRFEELDRRDAESNQVLVEAMLGLLSASP